MDNLARVKAVYQAFTRGALTEVVEQLHHSVHWYEAESSPYADGNPYVGPDEVAGGVFQRLQKDYPDLQILAERYYEMDNKVVVEGRYKGLHHVTKKPLDAQFVHVWQLKDGRVRQFRQFTDTLKWRLNAFSL